MHGSNNHNMEENLKYLAKIKMLNLRISGDIKIITFLILGVNKK